MLTTNRFVKKYNLQLKALTLMMNYKRNRGLTNYDKKLLKSVQRYFNKIQHNNLEPAVGDAVINDRNIKEYERNYALPTKILI